MLRRHGPLAALVAACLIVTGCAGAPPAPAESPAPVETAEPTPSAAPAESPTPTESPTPVEPPSPEAVELADAAFLTELGRTIFFEAQPLILDAESFRGECADVSTGEVMEAVGCWRAADQRIVVYHPADPRLTGFAVETAAHELLHAAFDRLTPQEQDEIAELTQTELDRLAADHPIRERIAGSIEQGGPDSEVTERFAYLGASVHGDDGFDQRLEAYYARYVADRPALVAVGLAVRTMLEGMVEELDTGWPALAAAEQANAQARARLEADERMVQDALAGYDEGVDLYDATPTDQREGLRLGWSLGDGSEIPLQPAPDALAALAAWIEDLDADVSSRRDALEAAETAAAAERVRLEEAGQDYQELVGQLQPIT